MFSAPSCYLHTTLLVFSNNNSSGKVETRSFCFKVLNIYFKEMFKVQFSFTHILSWQINMNFNICNYNGNRNISISRKVGIGPSHEHMMLISYSHLFWYITYCNVHNKHFNNLFEVFTGFLPVSGLLIRYFNLPFLQSSINLNLFHPLIFYSSTVPLSTLLVFFSSYKMFYLVP